MTNQLKNAALTAFRLALRPLIRVLLRNGISYREAGVILKQTYVEVAGADYGVYGRPTNASRVAILTGIGRHEVTKIRDQLAAGPDEAITRMNSATRLLGGWHNDAEFCDKQWRPLPLPADGDGLSFAGLCKRYAPDIPPTAMAKELLRVGAISETADGSYEAHMRYYMPESQNPDAILRAGSVLEDLGDTIAYNLARQSGSEEATRFEGRASSLSVPASAAGPFRQYLEGEAQGLLERVDLWLSQQEQKTVGKRSGRTLRLGVGVFQIQGDGE